MLAAQVGKRGRGVRMGEYSTVDGRSNRTHWDKSQNGLRLERSTHYAHMSLSLRLIVIIIMKIFVEIKI